MLIHVKEIPNNLRVARKLVHVQCTSTVKSKSSGSYKALHLSADDVIKMLTSDEDEAEPPAKKLKCTIDVEQVIMGQ